MSYPHSEHMVCEKKHPRSWVVLVGCPHHRVLIEQAASRLSQNMQSDRNEYRNCDPNSAHLIDCCSPVLKQCFPMVCSGRARIPPTIGALPEGFPAIPMEGTVDTTDNSRKPLACRRVRSDVRGSLPLVWPCCAILSITAEGSTRAKPYRTRIYGREITGPDRVSYSPMKHEYLTNSHNYFFVASLGHLSIQHCPHSTRGTAGNRQQSPPYHRSDLVAQQEQVITDCKIVTGPG
ncbi:hypothetical protein BJX62DRAFT_153808 [Aspergillus germanicus]